MPSPGFCNACLLQQPPFRAVHALFAYQEPVISLILDLKFRQRLAYARIFGELLAERVKSQWYASKVLPDLLIPVPLHEKRLQERGFNQALELARPLAATLPLSLDWKSVRRLENTLPQRSLTASKREKNMKNAFAVENDFTGKSIAILDDVMTTGATVTELSRALLARGADSIDIWCCARA